jgi:hypothetical protein
MNTTNTSSFLHDLKKLSFDELELPNPEQLFNKQNELEEKEKLIENKLKEIYNKEKQLEEKEKLIENKLKETYNNFLKLKEIYNKEKQLEEKEKLIENKLKDTYNNFNILNIKKSLLPKVDEKIDHTDFMLRCCNLGCVEDGLTKIYNNIKENYIFESILNDNDVYLVYVVKNKLVITNRGHIFRFIRRAGFNDGYYYWNLEIEITNDKIIKMIEILSSTDVNCDTDKGHFLPHISKMFF